MPTIVPRLGLVMEYTATEIGPVKKTETLSQAFQWGEFNMGISCSKVGGH